MFIVQDGEVDIVVGGKVVETVGPDGFFGELALIDSTPRSADALARTNCKLLPLNQHRFTFMVDEIPFFAIRVMKVMADRLRRAAGVAI
jgi:CRP-like cAMP-binding protein